MAHDPRLHGQGPVTRGAVRREQLHRLQAAGVRRLHRLPSAESTDRRAASRRTPSFLPFARRGEGRSENMFDENAWFMRNGLKQALGLDVFCSSPIT